jgi:broad-specificity NMP kinase
MIPSAAESRRPRLVELAGPAGVGKSTLSLALHRRCSSGQGTIWGLPPLALLGNGFRMSPVLLGMCLEARSPLWDETRHMVRLSTLHRRLTLGGRAGDLMICDEGPVFALAWLRGFGHSVVRSRALDAWWRGSLEQWARAVDAVVVLDAPDAVLAKRIRARSEWHEVKDASNPEISVWMDRFRLALEWVLAGLTAHGGPLVVRISTEGNEPERIAERVLAALARRSHDN